MPISSEPALSHRPWVSPYRARPRSAEFHHITTNFTAADTKQTRKAFRSQAGGGPRWKRKCDRKATKPGMLGVDRVGDRRSQTILAPNFSEKNESRHKKGQGWNVNLRAH